MANTTSNSSSSNKKDGRSSGGVSRIRQRWKKVTGHIKGKTSASPNSPLKESYMNSSFMTPVPRSPESTRPTIGGSVKKTIIIKKASSLTKSVPAAKAVPSKRASTEAALPIVVPTKTTPTKQQKTSTMAASAKTRRSPPPPVAAHAVAIALAPSAPPTPRNHKKRCSPIKSCIGNNDDTSSEVEMVSIDMESPPMYSRKEASVQQTKIRSPSKNQLESDSGRLVLRIHDKDNDTNKIESRMATKAESMMTPDMLETLDITTVDENAISRWEYKDSSNSSDRGNGDTTIPVPKLTQSRSALRSSRERQAPPKKNIMFERRAAKKNKRKVSFCFNDTASCLYYADDDDTLTKASMASTCATSSSSSQSQTSKETCDDWTYDNADDESTYISFRRDSSLIDCDPMSLSGMILTMPAAFGLLFVDNILNTKFFDAAIGEIPKPANSHTMKKRKTKKSGRRDDSRDSVFGHNFLPAAFQPCFVL